MSDIFTTFSVITFNTDSVSIWNDRRTKNQLTFACERIVLTVPAGLHQIISSRLVFIIIAWDIRKYFIIAHKELCVYFHLCTEVLLLYNLVNHSNQHLSWAIRESVGHLETYSVLVRFVSAYILIDIAIFCVFFYSLSIFTWVRSWSVKVFHIVR